jgi:hypothetical protein
MDVLKEENFNVNAYLFVRTTLAVEPISKSAREKLNALLESAPRDVKIEGEKLFLEAALRYARSL